MQLRNIRNLNLVELIAEIESIGEKKFRAKQIYEWLWKKSATEFNEMTPLGAVSKIDIRHSVLIFPWVCRHGYMTTQRTRKLHSDDQTN